MHMKRITVYLYIFTGIIFTCNSHMASGQTFTVIDSLQEGFYGNAAWGDYDNDGLKDLVYLAQGIPKDFCYVFHNTGEALIKVSQHFPILYNPGARWADMDNDGFDDLVMNGMDSTFHNRTVIFKSNGDGSFTEMPNTVFPLTAGAVDIADYNNDGWKDIAVCGMDSMGVDHAFIYKGTGAFTFIDISAPLFGVHFGELKFGDYNNDGLADLVINGIGSMDYRTRLYRNMGGDVFELQPFYMKGSAGTVDWMDNDNDGFRDILVTGNDSTSGQIFTELHRNNGDGTFTLEATNLPGFGEPSGAVVADFNNDGFMDVCFTGGSSEFPLTGSAMALGQGSDTFSVSAFFPGEILAPIAEAADIDNDGDTDLFFGRVILRNDLLLGSGTAGKKDVTVSVFPNPAYDKVYIKSEKEIEEVTISDLRGRILLTGRQKTHLFEMKINDLVAGIYLAKIRLAGNSVVTEKIIVKRN